VQEYNRNNARLQAGQLSVATIAMLIPSAVVGADTTFKRTLSLGLSVLLIVTYGLGLVLESKAEGLTS
jgi:Ca2+:H+ antiporter